MPDETDARKTLTASPS